MGVTIFMHDDVIQWKHFPRYWPFVRGIHRSLVNSPHKGQWRGALMFTLICARINGWVNNREAGDLRRYRAHYDVIVMESNKASDKDLWCFLVLFTYLSTWFSTNIRWNILWNPIIKLHVAVSWVALVHTCWYNLNSIFQSCFFVYVIYKLDCRCNYYFIRSRNRFSELLWFIFIFFSICWGKLGEIALH